MRTSLIITVIGLTFFTFTPQADFLTQQKRYPRVRTAIKEKQHRVENALKKNGLNIDNFNLLLVAYKDHDLLELFVKKEGDSAYKKIQSYEICAKSGSLGPKRRQGDHQIPEGFYYVDRFNPASYFYLSLGIDYPNQADRKKSKFSNLGGDIFIHGACVTIGCLPMTDEKIKEIYLYAVHAKNNGQSEIPVYIFPFKMTDENMVHYQTKFKEDDDLLNFWSNLKVGYDKFFLNKEELKIGFTKNGDYKF